MILNQVARIFRFPLLFFPLLLLNAAGQSITADFVETESERLDTLFSQLDRSHPAMGPIINLWNSGERLPAAEQLDTYFSNRNFSIDFMELPPVPDGLEEQARAALDNRFFILDSWEQVPADPEGHLDWSYRGKQNDKEMAWMLNRHAFLPLLANAYQESGDNSFRVKLNSLWQDWIESNPYPGRLSFSPAWRPLEVARRILNSWSYLFFTYDVMDPGTRLMALASIHDHADSLHNHASFWGGNHLISEKLALLTIAHAWPEFTDSAEWQDDSIEEISNQILEQTYPDGSYKELSNHYQRVVLVNAQLFMNLLSKTDPGFADRAVARRITEMWNFFARSMRPDGFGPLNNASDLEANATFIHNIWAMYNRPDWLFMATNEERGTFPAGSSSEVFQWAGQVFIRKNWKRDSDWIYFDAGPYGTAHQHMDRMHLSAVLKGRPVLVDAGRYTYKPGPWRSFFKGPESHNVLKLDGRPARQFPREVNQPVPISFQDLGEVIFTGASSQFPDSISTAWAHPLSSPVPWTRSILYDKRGFCLILDHLVAFKKHLIETSWNFHPEVTASEASRLLHLVAGPQDFKIVTKEGSYSPDYNRKISTVRLVHSGTIKNPTTFAWILQDPGTSPISIDLESQPGSKIFKGVVRQDATVIAVLEIQVFPEPDLISYKAL